MKRQLQVGNQLKQELGNIFIREASNYFKGAFVTIADVKMTPDLLEAKVYISVLNQEDLGKVMLSLERHKAEIRRKVGNALNHLRRIPELFWITDTSQEDAFRLEKLFNDMKAEDKGKGFNPHDYTEDPMA